MKPRFILFKRAGVFYSEDTVSRKQHSLRTKDEAEAVVLLNAKNESFRQPVLNVQIARAYLTAGDPAFAQRTWQSVMEQMQTHGKASTQARCATAMNCKAFDGLRRKKLMETNAEDFLAILNGGKVSVAHYLKRLHNLAVNLGWLAHPVLVPALWPKLRFKAKRGITLAEHQRILAAEKNPERNLFYQLLWEIGSSQSDAANLSAENIDWPTRSLTYLATVAVVSRKALPEAVAEFILGRKPLAEAKDGQRSKHSPVYERHVATWLNDFAETFPGHAVCDLAKNHLDAYVGKFTELSATSRNARRATVKMFLGWCAQKDYLLQNHRLFEAVSFKAEDSDMAEIDFYRPKELSDMLGAADAELMPVIALGGLAGLRREEILRLEWADVWRVKSKVEISARIAKGRKRRLVSICPALAAWLRPYRNVTGPVWSGNNTALEAALRAVREKFEIPSRRNGLRHAFITFHMAKHTNENLTAAEAGNSPAMIHGHYKGLATPKEAAQWFGVKPSRAALAQNIIRLGKVTAK